MKGALVAIRPEIELERLEFEIGPIGDVVERERGEVGLTGEGAQAGEFGRLDVNDVVAFRGGVCEGLELG